MHWTEANGVKELLTDDKALSNMIMLSLSLYIYKVYKRCFKTSCNAHHPHLHFLYAAWKVMAVGSVLFCSNYLQTFFLALDWVYHS